MDTKEPFHIDLGGATSFDLFGEVLGRAVWSPDNGWGPAEPREDCAQRALGEAA